MLRSTLLVGLGGCVGSCARYWAGVLTLRLANSGPPWSTALVNVTGCLLIGWLAGLTGPRTLGQDARLFWIVGFLGGFTTFSTFGYETWGLLEQGRTTLAVCNAFGQLALGLLAVLAGTAAARAMA